MDVDLTASFLKIREIRVIRVISDSDNAQIPALNICLLLFDKGFVEGVEFLTNAAPVVVSLDAGASIFANPTTK